MSKPRGHSNVHAEQTERYGDTDRASIPIAAFDSITGTLPDDPLPRSEREVTAFIKRRTDLYRRSWLLSPLREALSILNGEE